MKQTDFDPVLKLSPRELEIFTLVGHGNTTKEIAAKLKLSAKTVESHRANIQSKTKIRGVVAIQHMATRFVIFCEQNKVKLVETPLVSAPRLQFNPA